MFRKATLITVYISTVLTTALAQPGHLPAASWLERIHFINLDAGIRLRYEDAASHFVTHRDLHYKMLSRLRFDISGKNRLYAQARVESGDSFTNDHNYSGLFFHRQLHEVHVKGIFAGLRLTEQTELQAGSLNFENGTATQATYADNDGWMEGYRLTRSAARPFLGMHKWSVTTGYIGEFRTPDFFRRVRRLADLNHLQITAIRNLSAATHASGEFYALRGIPFARAALTKRIAGLPLVDELTLEVLGRFREGPGAGGALSAFKYFGARSRWRLGSVYSDLPHEMFSKDGKPILLNADSVSVGRRIGVSIRFAVTRDVEAIFFVSHRLNDVPSTRNRAEFCLRYHMAELFNKWLRGTPR